MPGTLSALVASNPLSYVFHYYLHFMNEKTETDSLHDLHKSSKEYISDE